MSLSCFKNLIGLDSVQHECFTDIAPPCFDESESGFMVMDSDFGIEAVMGNCTIDGWTLLEKARKKAIADFKTDLSSALLSEYNQSIMPWKGLIGQAKATSSGTATSPFNGISMKPFMRQKGVKFVMTGLRIGYNLTQDYPVQVVSSDPDFTSIAQTFAALTANTWNKAEFDSEVELPFWSDNYPDCLEYFISVERGTAKPLANVFSCCGNNPAWKQYVDARGFGASTADGESANYYATPMGIALEGYLTCEQLDWICELDYLNGYATKQLIGKTLGFRAGAVACALLADERGANLCPLASIEVLQATRNALNKSYAQNIAYIAENLPSGVTDCFSCKPERTLSKSKIIL